MGIDIIGWRDCPLQESLGTELFLGRLKLLEYRRAAERMAPDRLDTLRIKVRIDGQAPRVMDYRAICGEAQSMLNGIPECERCPISGGRRLGCYHYVHYPLDESFERLIFEYFIEQVPFPDSACNQIFRDVIFDLPQEGLSWHDRRGPGPGNLTARAEPLRYCFDAPIDASMDSAQVLAAVFQSLGDLPSVMAYSVFWNEFVIFLRGRPLDVASSNTVAEILKLGDFFKLIAVDALTEGATVLVHA